MADPSQALNPGDIIEVRLNCTMYAQRFITVFHYRVAGTAIPTAGWAALGRLGNALKDDAGGWMKKYQSAASDKLAFDYIDVQKIFEPRLLYRRIAWNSQGLIEGAAAPQNTMASITKQSTVAGRTGRGRMEVGGLPASYFGEGVLNAAGFFNLTPIANAMTLVTNLAETDVTTAEPVIFNAFAPAGSATLVNATVMDTVRVSRRRTVRVGI